MAAPKKSPTVAKPPRPRVPQLREAILAAVAEGHDPETLVLRLTLRDESELKRDRSVALDEISFAGGQMKFLGVTVVSGGVTESALDRSGS